MDPNHDIVPTLRMFDGLMMTQAADEIERLRAQLQTPNASLPPLGDGPRRDMVVTVSVPANWESRLDMQWVLEREIHADRWRWNWPTTEACTWPACGCQREQGGPCARSFTVQAVGSPDFPSGGPGGGGLTQCDMHDDESY